MKKYIKIISIFILFIIISGIAYASVRTDGINKLPWNGAGLVYEIEHHRGTENAGNVSRFTGTKGVGNLITDTRTGLMWESVPNSGSTTMSWETAKTHCSSLSLGGFTDWRLPNIRELMSIVDYSKSDGSNYWYDSKFNLGVNNYWSSTTYADYTSRARFLDFSSAFTNYNDKNDYGYRVICTR